MTQDSDWKSLNNNDTAKMVVQSREFRKSLLRLKEKILVEKAREPITSSNIRTKNESLDE